MTDTPEIKALKEYFDQKFSNLEGNYERTETRLEAHSRRLDDIEKSGVREEVQLTTIFSSLELYKKTLENVSLKIDNGFNDIRANYVSKEMLAQKETQSASARWIAGLLGTITGGFLMMLFYAIVAFVGNNT